MRTYESEPELGSEAQVWQMQNMHDQLEIKVESPISNANAQDFIARRRKVNNFHKAVLRGDWKSVETAVTWNQNLARIAITERGDRALHIAAAAKQTGFVQNLVEHLNTNDLEFLNADGYTAFCFAAVSGAVKIARVMYKKNKILPTIRNNMGKTPLEIAISLGHRKMVEYLYQITPLQELSAKEYIDIFLATIDAEMYDIALKIYSGIDISTTNMGRALKALARKPLRVNGFRGHWMWVRLVSIVATILCIPYFGRVHSTQEMMRQAHQLVAVLWERVMTLSDSDISELIQENQIFDDAAKLGNVEFLTLLTNSYPDLLWKVNEKYQSIFHVAVINRQENVFVLIHQTGAVKNLITLYKDDEGNNILHLAGKLAPPNRLHIVPGAALQMQRELLWFKEVEKIVPSSFLHMKNNDGITPRELFSREHVNLMEAGEAWMKNTVSFCLVVATLIATVAFAAAITIPGGNNQESGTPILSKDRRFKFFVIYNEVAMFLSATSIMLYLFILTSSYEEDDFLFLLPAKLTIGLSSVLASMLFMVVTFSSIILSVYNDEKQWRLARLVASIGILPISLFAALICRLLLGLVHSPLGQRTLMFRPGKHRLY